MDDCKCICVTQPIFPHPIKGLGIQNNRYKYDKNYTLSLRKHSFFHQLLIMLKKLKLEFLHSEKEAFIQRIT